MSQTPIAPARLFLLTIGLLVNFVTMIVTNFPII